MPPRGPSPAMARPGNTNTTGQRHHLDTIRLAAGIDMNGYGEAIARMLHRMQVRAQAEAADRRELAHILANLRDLREEMLGAVSGLERKAAA